MQFVVRAYYKFVEVTDGEALRDEIFAVAEANDLKGIVLVAPEGINSTISGTKEGIDAYWSFLTSDPRFADIEFKDSHHEEVPFKKLKVKFKKEIITMRNPLANPGEMVGRYVEPKDWNALITDPDVMVLDTRNVYEYIEGTFKGAVDPRLVSFGEFPEWVENNLDPSKHKKVAMFCTGGIRCEKTTAYMLAKGFEEVYHLKGGILKYLEEIPEEESLWEGGCFIFDNRDCLVTGLKPVPRQYDQDEIVDQLLAGTLP